MASWGIVSLSRVVLLRRLGLMLRVILQRNQDWLSVGEHDSMARLSCLLLEATHPGVTVGRRLRRVRRPGGNHSHALSMGISGSLGTLREVQGGEGDLFTNSTASLAGGNQTTDYLLHLDNE